MWLLLLKIVFRVPSDAKSRERRRRMILGHVDKYEILCFGGGVGRGPGSLLSDLETMKFRAKDFSTYLSLYQLGKNCLAIYL